MTATTTPVAIMGGVLTVSMNTSAHVILVTLGNFAKKRSAIAFQIHVEIMAFAEIFQMNTSVTVMKDTVVLVVR